MREAMVVWSKGPLPEFTILVCEDLSASSLNGVAIELETRSGIVSWGPVSMRDYETCGNHVKSKSHRSKMFWLPADPAKVFDALINGVPPATRKHLTSTMLEKIKAPIERHLAPFVAVHDRVVHVDATLQSLPAMF